MLFLIVMVTKVQLGKKTKKNGTIAWHKEKLVEHISFIDLSFLQQ